MYQDLSGTKHIDYRYNTKSEYHNEPTTTNFFRKKTIKRETTSTRRCPSCGLLRSSNNKCFCNED